MKSLSKGLIVAISVGLINFQSACMSKCLPFLSIFQSKKDSQLARYEFRATEEGENNVIEAWNNKSQKIGKIDYVYQCPYEGSSFNRPFIKSLYVNPNFRRQGIASELLKRAFADIKEKSENQKVEIDLEVYPFGVNPPTQKGLVKFYKKNGGVIFVNDRQSFRSGSLKMRFEIQKQK